MGSGPSLGCANPKKQLSIPNKFRASSYEVTMTQLNNHVLGYLEFVAYLLFGILIFGVCNCKLHYH